MYIYALGLAGGVTPPRKGRTLAISLSHHLWFLTKLSHTPVVSKSTISHTVVSTPTLTPVVSLLPTPVNLRPNLANLRPNLANLRQNPVNMRQNPPTCCQILSICVQNLLICVRSHNFQGL